MKKCKVEYLVKTIFFKEELFRFGLVDTNRRRCATIEAIRASKLVLN